MICLYDGIICQLILLGRILDHVPLLFIKQEACLLIEVGPVSVCLKVLLIRGHNTVPILEGSILKHLTFMLLHGILHLSNHLHGLVILPAVCIDYSLFLEHISLEFLFEALGIGVPEGRLQ